MRGNSVDADWLLVGRYVSLVCLLSAVVSIADVVKGPIEVCNREFLNISCSVGEVILIDSALYGRMRVGRCVHQSLGYVDCRTDAINHVEMWCSGRRRCEVRVPDDELYDMKPCPADTTSYLETTYRCIRVDGGAESIAGSGSSAVDAGGLEVPSTAVGPRVTSETCRSFARGVLRNVTASGPSGGYIMGILHSSSAVGEDPSTSGSTVEDVVGTHGCPWVIEALPGQRVNLSLFDFLRRRVPTDTLQASTLQRNRNNPNEVCSEIAMIRDGDRTRNIRSCMDAQHNRRRHVYLSVTSSVEVTFLRRNSDIIHGSFLIHYTAVGCPQLIVSPHASYHQPPPVYAMVGSTAIVRCNSTNMLWTLTCNSNNTWATSMSTTITTNTANIQQHHQLIGDCPSMTAVSASAGTTRGKHGSLSMLDALLSTDDSIPYGVFLAVALGVALGVFLGGFFLALIAINRRRHIAAAAVTAGHYDFNEIGLAQHEMFDVTADTYMTSTTTGSRQRPAMAPNTTLGVHKFVDGDSTVPIFQPHHHHNSQQFAAAPCRMQQTTFDCTTGSPMAMTLTGRKLDEIHEHYASSVRGMTMFADDGPTPAAAVRYYDM